jgi:molecular chaperone GrpE
MMAEDKVTAEQRFEQPSTEQQPKPGEACGSIVPEAQTEGGEPVRDKEEHLQPGATPGEQPQTVEELAQLLEQTSRKAEEHWNDLLRLRAEMENLRKRSAKEVENAHKFALERFLSELLPVKDSMELGLAASHEAGAELSKLREGAELTLKMLNAVWQKFGIEEVDPVHQPFNPEQHQAIAVQESDQVTSGKVVHVVQKGYLLNGRLVRPALVIVAK